MIKSPLFHLQNTHIYGEDIGFFPQQAIHVYCSVKAAILYLQTYAAKGTLTSLFTASIQTRDT